MERLADKTESLRQRSARMTVGRYLQAHAQCKGDSAAAAAWLDGDAQRRWTDREVLKAAVTQIGVADYPEIGPVGEAFLAAMRTHSVPLQLEAWLRRV